MGDVNVFVPRIRISAHGRIEPVESLASRLRRDIPRTPGGVVVDPREAAERAVESPHGPRIPELVSPNETVAIVVTDVTRATPDDILLDVLLSELADVGVPRNQITVVIGLGLHRPMTDEEIADALGERADLAENHDADSAVEVGRVTAGESEIPIELNPTVADADRVFSTGMVEPHQYAGFSGGAKTVAIGAGGESLIRYTHGPEMLARDGVRLGRTADNPFRETLDEAGDAIGLDFCLNVTHGPDGVLGAVQDTTATWLPTWRKPRRRCCRFGSSGNSMRSLRGFRTRKRRTSIKPRAPPPTSFSVTGIHCVPAGASSFPQNSRRERARAAGRSDFTADSPTPATPPVCTTNCVRGTNRAHNGRSSWRAPCATTTCL
ncbi:lactate racemase domain-containing protein [Haladaptatus pallidirubidus]|uniref:lactate racemase domain-containing protein n=1 Tax=Haladaptatus pallidirubidus TaxID=1008152 RepID=UPI0035E60174